MTIADFRRVIERDRARSAKAGLFGRITVRIFRIGQLSVRGSHPFTRLLALVVFLPLDVLWSRLAMGAELPRSLECGPGLALCHGGRGVIINPGTRIGADVTILHFVTFGNASPRQETPVISDGVFVGAKASVIGGVNVGPGAVVAAHAIVTRDIPTGYIARGPAAEAFAPRAADQGGAVA